MNHILNLKNTIPFDDLTTIIKKIEFRGLYNEKGEKIKPYKKAQFSIVKVYPSSELGGSPTIKTCDGKKPLFSPQPTIYLNQTDIVKTVDDFLIKNKMRVNELKKAIEYEWEGRGVFHMLPPIIEKHVYTMDEGFIDLDILTKSFQDFFVNI